MIPSIGLKQTHSGEILTRDAQWWTGRRGLWIPFRLGWRRIDIRGFVGTGINVCALNSTTERARLNYS